jgi:ribonuclease-3
VRCCSAALTHRSFAYEKGGLPTNERLEFLGDAVLGLVVTDHLYSVHPDLPEGQLAKLRAAVVNMNALADVARGIGLGDWLLVGRGEETTGGRDKASILADGLEALIGAVYLDRGLGEAAALIHRFFDDVMEESASRGASLDWKTSLQELTATQLLGVPEYVVTEVGPGPREAVHRDRHDRRRRLGVGRGPQQEGGGAEGGEAAWTSLQHRALAGDVEDLAAGAVAEAGLVAGFDGGSDVDAAG